ncbi:MAG: adenosylcobinamide-GDP ribazoletransferase [Clostridia bacterium]|nr:adenosylcobinamide-GDP ribazoletransferase [Clostridia bacterium]
MKKLWNSLIIAFSMYSRLPVPRVEWAAANMSYSMCFFPLIGCVIGALLLLLDWLCGILGFSSFLKAALLLLLPIAVSGGIHMDGFLDTADAIASRAPREKKLEILKDSHAGAFAIIWGGLYLILYLAVLNEFDFPGNAVYLFALIPVLSRSLSGLSVACFKNARKEGLLAAFSGAADKRRVRVTLILWILLAVTGALILSPLMGGAMLLAAGLCFLGYYLIAYRSFGGATGDLAGFFLQSCEFLCLCAMLLTQCIAGL